MFPDAVPRTGKTRSTKLPSPRSCPPSPSRRPAPTPATRTRRTAGTASRRSSSQTVVIVENLKCTNIFIIFTIIIDYNMIFDVIH